MTRLAYVVLFALAANAVLIQTILVGDTTTKNLVRVAVLGLVVAAIAIYRVRIPLWIFMATLLSAVLLVARGNIDQLSYVFVLLLVPALREVPDRRLLKIVALGSVSGLALIFFFLAAGVTTNTVLDVRQRATYGTAGVPFFYNVVYGAASLSVLYAFKYQLRRRWLVLAVAAVGATYLFATTDARGGYACFLIFLALLAVLPKLGGYPPIRDLIVAIPIVCLVVALLIGWNARNYDLNVLMSYRPRLYGYFLDNVTWADVAFSTSVKQFDERVSSVSTVDNSWLHLLVGGGALIFIGFFVVFAMAVRRLWADGRFPELAFVVATCVYFNSESLLLRIENLFVIYFWVLLLSNATRSTQEPAQDARTSRTPIRATSAA